MTRVGGWKLGVLALGVLVSLPASGEERATSGSGGTVLTFYGVRQLEQDPSVTDEEKVRQWRAFIERARKQLAYAQKAAERWQEAPIFRLIETAQQVEKDPGSNPRQRIAQWMLVADKYPKSEQATRARERVRYWQGEELARLVQQAEGVESAGRPKVARIQAWLSVVEWAPKTKEAKAAQKRVRALQTQLFAEAEGVDRLERLDARIKRQAWQDVLRGQPTPVQRKKATRRLSALGGR